VTTGETFTEADIRSGLEQYPEINLEDFLIGVKNAAELRRRAEIEEITSEAV
jgi:hypothetical protein